METIIRLDISELNMAFIRWLRLRSATGETLSHRTCGGGGKELRKSKCY